MGEVTTIKVNTATRKALQALKGAHSYDELMALFLRLVPEGDAEGAYSSAFRYQLLEAKLDIAQGRTHSLDSVQREFGL